MIYLGNNEIQGIKLGNDDIAGIYIGDNQIYPTTVSAWSVSPSAITISSSGGTERIKIEALDSWTISSSENWITFSQNSGDSGRTRVTATIAANDSTARTATITVEDTGQTTAFTISVSQEALAFSVSPSALTAGISAETINLTISSPFAWTATSSESWAVLSTGSGLNGITIITVSVPDYAGDTERTATITVGNGTDTSAITLTQTVCDPIVISSLTLSVYNLPAETEYFNNCNFDTTGVYSLEQGYGRGEYVRINVQPAITTLRGVDIHLNWEGTKGNDTVRFNEAFKDCTALESVNISGIEDYKVISCYAMFRGCTALTSVTMNSFVAGYEGGSMSSYDYMFYGCSNLVTINALDLTRWSNVTNMFAGCTSLENLTITAFKDDNLTTWHLEDCTALTVTSLVGIFNALPTTQNSRTIQIGTTNKNKLSAAELAIATDKGWSVQ